jgi:Zn finger protein HypA/HybF involved in hydrogenase expression
MRLFRFILTLGFVVLWSIFIWSIVKEHLEFEKKYSVTKKTINGMHFHLMGGYGTLSCKDCDFSQNITSFTHGLNTSNSGFQCQSCGKLTSRRRDEPFKNSRSSNHHLSLSELPIDERPSTIEHLQRMLHLCESQMKQYKKKDWLPTWESTVAECKEELSTVTAEELAAIKKRREDFEATYKATLFCECEGHLDREAALFCPNCKSLNLAYDMQYIT